MRQFDEVASIVAAGEWAAMTAAVSGRDFKELVNRTRNLMASCTLDTGETVENIQSDAILKSVNDVLEAAFKLKIEFKI